MVNKIYRNVCQKCISYVDGELLWHVPALEIFHHVPVTNTRSNLYMEIRENVSLSKKTERPSLLDDNF